MKTQGHVRKWIHHGAEHSLIPNEHCMFHLLHHTCTWHCAQDTSWLANMLATVMFQHIFQRSGEVFCEGPGLCCRHRTPFWGSHGDLSSKDDANSCLEFVTLRPNAFFGPGNLWQPRASTQATALHLWSFWSLLPLKKIALHDDYKEGLLRNCQQS